MTSNPTRANDDSAVAAVLDEVYSAWAAGDAEGGTTPKWREDARDYAVVR